MVQYAIESCDQNIEWKPRYDDLSVGNHYRLAIDDNKDRRTGREW